MKMTDKDAINAMRRINFLEREAELKKKYHKLSPKPYIDKDMVFEVITKLGYEPGFHTTEFYIKNQNVGDIKLTLGFRLKGAVVDIFLNLYEGKQFLYGGPLLCWKRDVADDIDYRSGKASFTNYEELEAILSILFGIFEDFKRALREELEKE